MDAKFLLTCGALLAAGAFAESYEWGNVRFDGGGFVSAVLPSPYQKDLVYARTDVGGVYRWSADDTTWVPLTDWISEADKGLYGAESFALDPTDPAKLYVLAGTGYFSDGRTAILISDDYGETFDTSYVEFLAHGNGLGRQAGEKLAVDPNSPNILFCGSRSMGLYKSEDYGKTWENVLEIATSSATGSSLSNVNGVSFVLFDSSSSTLSNGATSTLYMGISETSENLWVSTDGGDSWTEITGGPSSYMPNRAKLAGGYLWLTYCSSMGPHSVTNGAVYKYEISSGTWTNITPYQDGSTSARMGDGSNSVSHGFGGISIDPDDSDHVIISTLNYYGGQHLYADGSEGWGDRIYVSQDGGETWITTGQSYGTEQNIDNNGNAWIAGNAIHWAGSIEFDPFDTDKAWVTSGNGVFWTDNVNDDRPIWKFQSKGIEETVPLDIVSVPDGPLVTAIGDYDGAAYTDILTSTARHSPSIGTTQSLGYAAQVNAFARTGQVTDYSTGTGITSDVMYYTTDVTGEWTELSTTPQGSLGLVVLSSDGEVILHRPEGYSSVYRSEDMGSSWTEVSGLDGQDQYAAIVPDPVDEDVFYVLSAQGTLKRSTDKGASFEEYGSAKDESNSLYYNGGGLIRTVPEREGHLWAPLDQSQTWLTKGYSENGLAYSEDGGLTWTRLSTVSTAIAVGLGKAYDGADYETIYIWGVAGDSEDLGIYRSIDKGESWTRVNDDEHQFGGPGNGNFVAGDYNTFGVVYMSTVGRGLIVGAPEGTFEQGLPIQEIVRPSSTVALSVQARNLHVNAPSGSNLVLLDANGRLLLSRSVGPNTNVSLERLASGTLFAKVVSSAGKTLAQKAVSLK